MAEISKPITRYCHNLLRFSLDKIKWHGIPAITTTANEVNTKPKTNITITIRPSIENRLPDLNRSSTNIPNTIISEDKDE